MIDFIKNLFFVRKCVLCGEVLENENEAFCPKCRLEVDKLCRLPCGVCGKKQRDCRCLPSKLSSDVRFGVHLFAFDDALSRKITYTFKHQNLSHLRHTLAKMLAHACMELPISLSDYAVTYAPRKPKSVREYGFDQSKLLAEELAKLLHLPMAEMFRHARFSALQKNLSAKERAENAEKSYSLIKHIPIEQKKLIIVDDVITTGSTLAKLTALAKEAGFEEIILVFIAKTPAKEKELICRKEV